MSAAPSLYSIDQYLAIDRASMERYVYLDGKIYAMAGESPEHGDISANMVRILGNQLLDGPCRVRAKDTKVCSGRRPMTGRGTQGLFSYPDIVIVCDEPEYFDASRDILVNPAALVEVLSKTTESFDRGAKFTRYQRFNPSLREYLLVSQTHPEVEHYSKQQDGSWLYHLYTGLEAVVPIASIGCSLKLSEIYHRVRFPEPEIEEEPPRFETMS